MNDLTVIEREGILVIDSREVAKVLEVRHSDLLRDIEKYAESIENSDNAILRSQDFFIESTYTTKGNNKEYKNYLLTKKGCELVAHKRTGEDGIIFTALYINKFKAMEEALKKPVNLNSLDVLKHVTNVLETHDNKINTLEDKVENQITLDHGEQRRMQKAISIRVAERNKDTGIPKEKLFSALHRTLWDTFDVPSYKDIKRKDYSNALNLINTWLEKADLRNEYKLTS